MPIVSWRFSWCASFSLVHAVGTRHQHRLAVLVGQVEQGAEAAQAAHHFRPEAALDQGLDPLDQLVAGVDVDTRVTIGGGRGGRRGVGHGRRRWQVERAILTGRIGAKAVFGQQFPGYVEPMDV